MLIEGKITLKAPIEKLWDSLLEPNNLAACIPGMEQLELKDNNVYEGTNKQKLGPFSIKLKASVTMIELDKPNHLKGTIKGEALGGMGTVMGEVIVDFTDVGNDDVEIAYKMNVNIVGKLSVVGDRIMRAKAKSMEADIQKNFQEKLV